MDMTLAGYVFSHYTRFLTETEWAAYVYFGTLQKQNGAREGFLPPSIWDNLPDDQRAHWQELFAKSAADYDEDIAAAKDAATKDPVMKTLIEKFPNEFYDRVAHRIVRDHGNEIFLNLCPKCLNLCRTPLAKVCVRCGHSWHSEKS